MTNKIKQKYKAKAKDSFKTKKNLFLFHSVINRKSEINKQDFEDFDISEDLVKCYTSEYWQEELDYQINELKIFEIEKAINVIEKNYADIIKELETIYINSFSNIFPEKDFERLVSARKCHYCKITIDEIEELAVKKLLNKKTLRGWNLEIDRLNSNFEYTPKNCVMSCYWCNNAKTDEFTEAEFLKIGAEIKKVWEDRRK
jgi:5-methylcytosine-specific restriction endonuclease McrA